MKLVSYFPLLFAAALPVSSATINVIAVDSTRGGNVTFVENGVQVTGWAGAILASYDGGPQETFFCVDLFTPIGYGLYGSGAIMPRAGRNEDRVGWLYVNQLSTVTSANLGRAFQLAIWDIVHDNGDGPLAGAVRRAASTPSAVVTAWQNYLTVSVGQSSYAASTFVNYILSNGQPAQDFIGPWKGTPFPSEVPEPSSLVLTSSALLTAGFMRRRRS